MVYIRTPFGQAGDRTEVPVDNPGDGSVSFETGYGPTYELDPTTQAMANRIERNLFNGLAFRISSEIRQYQQTGVPDFITAAENNNVAFPYSIGAMVRFDPGSGVRVYRSLVDNNSELPTVTNNWLDTSTYAVSTGVLNNILADAGLSVSGTGTTRTISLDLNGITTNTNIATNHFLPFTTGSENRKTTIANFLATFITKGLIDPLNINADTLDGNQASAFVLATRQINTNANSGLTGGGNLSANRALSLDIENLQTANAVPGSEIAFSSGAGSTRNTTLTQAVSAVVTSGFINNLSGIDADTIGGAALSTLVRTTRTITTGDGLIGGGNLSGNRTLALDINGLNVASPLATEFIPFYDSGSSLPRRAAINTILGLRSVSTGEGIAGGGDLSADRTLTLDADSLEVRPIAFSDEIIFVDTNSVNRSTRKATVNSMFDLRTLTAGDGLSGGGTLSANRTLTLDVNDLTAEDPLVTDTIAFADLSASGDPTRKATIQDVFGLRSVTVSPGLTGGGSLSQNRNLTLDLDGLALGSITLLDTIAFADIGTTNQPTRKQTVANLLGLNQPGKTFTSAVTIQGLMTANQVRDLGGTSDERLKVEKYALDPDESLAAVISWRKSVAAYNAHAKDLMDCDPEDQVCFYAQDLERTHPQMVEPLPIPGDPKDGEYLMINYNRTPVVLASAIEAVSNKLDALEARLDALGAMDERLVELERILGV